MHLAANTVESFLGVGFEDVQSEIYTINLIHGVLWITPNRSDRDLR